MQLPNSQGTISDSNMGTPTTQPGRRLPLWNPLAVIALAIFIAGFTCEETQSCGQVITLKADSEDKYIYSPGFPNPYYENLNCQWKIESGDGFEIEIEFQELDLYLLDYVFVYEGSDQKSLLLAVVYYNDNGKKLKFRSSGKAFLIQFKTVVSNHNRKGFKIRYYTKENALSDLTPDTACRKDVVRLRATNESRYLTSPKYPLGYLPNSRCSWIIYSQFSNIEVEIEDLYIDSSQYCEKDYLSIYDGEDTNASPLTSVCGTLQYLKTGTKFRGSGQTMLIRFKTDDKTFSATGFRLRYQTKVDPSPDLANVTSCRGKIVHLNSTQEIQYITSFGYPDYFLPFSDCRWQITAASNYTAKLEFVNMDFVRCTKWNKHEYVEIFDGPSVYSKSLGQVCEGTSSFQSSGRYMTVNFRTTSQSKGKGFKLKYFSEKIDGSKDGSCNNRSSLIFTFMSAVLILVVFH